MSLKMRMNSFGFILIMFLILLSGTEGSRTPVQTYSSKAFYMFILALIVGQIPELNKPIFTLAGWVFCKRHSLLLQHFVFSFEGGTT